MGLSFGWKAGEVRDSFWIDDPDLHNVSEAARQAWEEDGDASHLGPFVKGKPTRITFRTLTPDEARLVQSVAVGAVDEIESMTRATLLAFRIGVDFPDYGPTVRTADGADHARIVKERGVRMLAPQFVAALDGAYPRMVTFYGSQVLRASFPSAEEKKASSPQSMPIASSAPVDAAVSTESPGQGA